MRKERFSGNLVFYSGNKTIEVRYRRDADLRKTLDARYHQSAEKLRTLIPKPGNRFIIELLEGSKATVATRGGSDF